MAKQAAVRLNFNQLLTLITACEVSIDVIKKEMSPDCSRNYLAACRAEIATLRRLVKSLDKARAALQAAAPVQTDAQSNN